MRLYLGVDPGVHRTGFAVVDQDGRIMGVWVVKSKEGTERVAVGNMVKEINSFWIKEELSNIPFAQVVVEGQEIIYTSKSGKNPRSLLWTAAISGAVMAFASLSNVETPPEIVLVAPSKWKGQVPKQVYQGRMWNMMNVPWNKAGNKKDGYAVPKEFEKLKIVGVDLLNAGDWKEVGDAIGIALWARDSERKAHFTENFKGKPLSEPAAQALIPKPGKKRKKTHAVNRHKKASAGARKGKNDATDLGERDPGNPGQSDPGGVGTGGEGGGGGVPDVRPVVSPVAEAVHGEEPGHEREGGDAGQVATDPQAVN